MTAGPWSFPGTGPGRLFLTEVYFFELYLFRVHFTQFESGGQLQEFNTAGGAFFLQAFLDAFFQDNLISYAVDGYNIRTHQQGVVIGKKLGVSTGAAVKTAFQAIYHVQYHFVADGGEGTYVGRSLRPELAVQTGRVGDHSVPPDSSCTG